MTSRLGVALRPREPAEICVSSPRIRSAPAQVDQSDLERALADLSRPGGDAHRRRRTAALLRYGAWAREQAEQAPGGATSVGAAPHARPVFRPSAVGGAARRRKGGAGGGSDSEDEGDEAPPAAEGREKAREGPAWQAAVSALLSAHRADPGDSTVACALATLYCAAGARSLCPMRPCNSAAFVA